MKDKQLIFIIICIGLFLYYGCKKEDHALLPEVKSYELINDSEIITSAKGTVISDGGAKVIERGICWSSNPIPTINDKKTIEGAGVGDFTSKLTGLVQGTTYFARAYATNRKGTTYGDVFSFIAGTSTDIDGNIYNMVTIGTQIWMKENLKTTKYNDGTPITFATTNAQWIGTTPKYCWYNNFSSNKNTIGALYKWTTINTGKLCPKGWHVSTSNEWETLLAFLGGAQIAGTKIKSTASWDTSLLPGGSGANNSSGFTALSGSGYRNNEGPEEYFMAWTGGSRFAYWWTVGGESGERAKGFRIDDHNPDVIPILLPQTYGLAVRCVKD